MEQKSSPVLTDDTDDVNVMVPKFLPKGEMLGWDLHSWVDPSTNTLKSSYVVTVRVAHHSHTEPDAVLVTCDGPCGKRFKSNRLIEMGKCDHVLCKACYGLVKNPDGSYGCSNFRCWADVESSFRQSKNDYRHVIKKQVARAKKLQNAGDDVKLCTEEDLPQTPCSTPATSPSHRSTSSTSSSDFSTSSGTSIDSFDFSGASGY